VSDRPADPTAKLLSLAILLAALLAPAGAHGQTWNYAARAQGYPTGVAVPNAGVASAEEPAALAVNPAAAGFNEGFTVQYFHEGARHLFQGDGVYLGAGPLAVTNEWLRPADGARYRKLGLGLGLGGRAGAIGVSWNDWSSPDPGVARLRTWDLGLTSRPARWLSLAATALDLGGRLGPGRLPVRYDLGVATRLLGDGLTVSLDWLADDDARRDLRSRALALGVGHEWRSGWTLQAQFQAPAGPGLVGVAGRPIFLATLGFNFAQAGVVVGSGGTGRDQDRQSSLVGVRLSSQRYRGPSLERGRPVLVILREELEPSRPFPFRAPRDPFGALLAKLRDLREDGGVSAVLLRLDDLSVGAARAEELRHAVAELAARKPVVAWLASGGVREYLVATAARRVEMAPLGTLALTGLASTGLYLRDTLARLGVTVEVISIGRFKSAGEPLSRTGPSEADREAREAILDDVFGRQVRAVASARKLTEARVRELVDEGLFSAEEARQAGLVDAISYPDELAQRMGLSSSGPGWSRPEPRAAQRWGPRPAVAVIRIEGAIVTGKSRGGVPLQGGLSGADTVTALVRQAAEDRDVRALVVRIDSPGGDALASDLIWHALVGVRRRGKPVVISMGDVAASGGYWIAMGGDAIVAEASTLTGSIGVVGLKPDLAGLLAKVDARAVTLKRGARADLFSLVRPWTADERAVIEKHMLAAYGLFLDRVAEGRKLPRPEVEALAQGRVWTGSQALERKLVDQLGSLHDALALARKRAGLAPGEAEVRRLEAPRGLLEGLDLGGARGASAVVGEWLLGSPELQAALAVAQMGPVAALPLEWLQPLAPAPAGPPGQ
jgi:protease-4